MFKGENPQAKANATLLQIQMNLYATAAIKGPYFLGVSSKKRSKAGEGSLRSLFYFLKRG
ncbi:hypothetical protein A9Z39_15565 [Paenibacillus polymyxa]|nr:hypothetical protein A9Z39_15565 [Paenibacillus polymyxa]